MKKRTGRKLNVKVFMGFLAFMAMMMFLLSFLFVGVWKNIFLGICLTFGMLICYVDFCDIKKMGYMSLNAVFFMLATLLLAFLHSLYQAIVVVVIYALGILCREITAHSKIKAEQMSQIIQEKKYHLYAKSDRITEDANKINAGDRVEILSGEIVPIDGEVISGEATVTTAGIDGNSKMFMVRVGAHLTAGLSVLSGCVVVRADGGTDNSTIENIKRYKSILFGTTTAHERVILKLINILSVSVWILGSLYFSVAAFLAGDISRLTYGIVWMCFFSCLDSFKGLLHYAYLNAAVRCIDNGIVVKTKRLVEKSMFIKNLLFRKQGVLSERTPVISKVIPIEGVSEAELISYAVYAQFRASHSVSKELIAEYGKRVKNADIAYFTETEDNGAMVQLKNGVEIITGNSDLLSEYGIVSGIISEEAVLCVAVNNVFIGHIVFEYPLKEDIRQYVDSLKYAGAKNLSIVTKDSERAAKSIAGKSGIKRYYSELNNKTLEKTVDAFGKNTVYIGYGKGDSYDFGENCAKLMYGGFRYDCQSTDGLFLSDSLGCVLKFFNIIKDTRRLLVENLLLSVVVSLITLRIMIAAPQMLWAGALTVVMGVFLNSLNCYRLTKKL